MSPDPSIPSADGGGGDLPVGEVARQLGLPVDLLVRRLRAGLLPGRRTVQDGAEEWWMPAAALGDAGSGAVSSPPVPSSSSPVAPSSTAPSTSSPTAPAAMAPLPFVPQPVGAPWPIGPAPLAWARPPAPTGPVSAVPEGREPRAATVPPGRTPAAAPPDGPSETGPPVGSPAEPVPVAKASPVQVVPARGTGDETGLTDAIGRVDIDARELVAALLERWERTYALRIEAETRLRYEGTINELRAQVARHEGEMGRMQAEVGEASALHAGTAAEHRAALADRDREVAAMREQLQARLAAIMERDRLIADRDRALDEARRAAAAPPPNAGRRSWWGRRTGDGQR